ncbi:hypothetical protein PAMP_003951 [Pampus punctatissimus]
MTCNRHQQRMSSDFNSVNKPPTEDLQTELCMTPECVNPFHPTWQTEAQSHVSQDMKDCLLTAKRKDAKSIKIMKNKDNVKFNVHCSRHLYTLVITDKKKAEKLKQSTAPGLAVEEDP